MARTPVVIEYVEYDWFVFVMFCVRLLLCVCSGVFWYFAKPRGDFRRGHAGREGEGPGPGGAGGGVLGVGDFVLEGDINLEEHATPYQTKMQAYAETGFSKYVWGRIGITQVSSLC